MSITQKGDCNHKKAPLKSDAVDVSVYFSYNETRKRTSVPEPSDKI